jgi:outer membrane receptor protein involved in Fe transport
MIDLALTLLWTAAQLAAMQSPRLTETMTVTAVAPSLGTPAAVTTLNRMDFESSPAATLDDALRSVPGFSLFRRSSSRVANPTTQGVTLRGLAASGASRALVLADHVPLNDPFGGWVYWNRVPSAALSEVSVARGAAGDLFGADALAGVISIRSAADTAVRALAEGGTDGLARLSGYGGYRRGFGAAEFGRTDGFVIVAPESRGPIDVDAGSRHAVVNAGVLAAPASGALWIRGSHFDEARRNGTPQQTNATRISQGSGRFSRALANGAAFGTQVYALTQRYEQTFSAVFAGRTAERLTTEQDVESTAMGAGAEYARSGRSGSLTLSGNLRRTSATLNEHEVSTGVRRTLEAQQTTAAMAGQARTAWRRLAAGAGVRLELWRTSQDATNQHVFLTPRAWVTFSPMPALQTRLAVQSGYRGPTINELYRPFRVGAIITQANPDLEAERARGLEAGVSYRRDRVHLRLVTFWSRVTDAIVNVTVSSAGDTILRQRQNAAEITAAGTEFEAELRVWPFMSLTGATSFTRSHFTEGTLDGRRVPQVPGMQHAIGARLMHARLTATADWRFIGSQFDDDLNAFELRRSSVLDARVGWRLRPGMELFGAVENALDEEQDVGRTPLRTIGLPRTSRLGLRVTF